MCSFGKWQRSNRGGEKSHAQAGFWTPCSHHERGIFPPHKNRFVIIFIFYTHHPPRRTQTCAGLRMRTKGLPVWPICANIISLSQKIFFSPSGCKNHPCDSKQVFTQPTVQGCVALMCMWIQCMSCPLSLNIDYGKAFLPTVIFF